MVRTLIAWALGSPLIVILAAATLMVVGLYSFAHINVEAYPDPAPAVQEIIGIWPGASAEEMERLVSVPLEVTLAGMPNLKTTHTKSLYGLSHVRCIFHYGISYKDARQEVINRLAMISQPLPPGVVPALSPANAIGEIFRYTIKGPKDALGRDIYTLNDYKALQDWLVEREFRRVPRIMDITSFGGTVKRYEIHPDPEMMKKYGITLAQINNSLANSNANVGGDYLVYGRTVKMIRCVGVIGGGKDPMDQAFAMKTPQEAAAFLREQERIRCEQIRDIVIMSVNTKPIKIDDIVVGGPLKYRGGPATQGVVVSNQTRLGRVSLDRLVAYKLTDTAFVSLRTQGLSDDLLVKLEPLKKKEFKSEPLFAAQLRTILSQDELDRHGYVVQHDAVYPSNDGTEWRRDDEKIQCIVLMRKDEQSLPALASVKNKFEELNKPGRLLPGVTLEPYYDREELIHLTTHTVIHNVVMGIILVSIILYMFVSNIRTAIIVSINIPLALFFAVSVLYQRGQSANLLSLGAVDFGIIVDSAVIVTENIYRNLTSGSYSELPFKDRILRYVKEIDKALFFSTLIMICAFIPLFTMSGAEGQLFGPMAQTYAFALGGALLMALTLTPVLCMFFFRNFKQPPPIAHNAYYVLPGENWLVRALKTRYIWNLRLAIRYPWATIGLMACLIVITVLWPMQKIGREFMPELEEGNLWVRAVFPVHVNLDAVKDPVGSARLIMSSERYPEVNAVMVQMGRPDDGTDPCGFNGAEFFVPLKPQRDWPEVTRPNGDKKVRTRIEIVHDMSAELKEKIPGVEWAFSQYIRDNVMEAISGVKGDNCVKIYGPDLIKLEELADRTKKELSKIQGLHDLGIYQVMGQSNFEFVVDKEKCKRWGVQVADVDAVINAAVRGNPATQMVEGEKLFDITVRWPFVRRQDEKSILEIPVDIWNNTFTATATTNQTTVTGGSAGVAALGTSNPNPTLVGQSVALQNNFLPRLMLKDLVSPVDHNGQVNPGGSYTRPGGSMITREQGKRFIAIKFSVRDDRDLASAVTEVEDRVTKLLPAPYRAEFGGEFEQMSDAEARLMFYVPASLLIIFMLLYWAFRSLLDAVVILSNVFDLAIGGIWALYLTGTNFSTSAAVGFVSLFGVSIMEGLLMISYFNDLRHQGRNCHDAIIEGAAKRVRPVMITAMTAILGLLPAALSTAIGAQTQRPLAIVVVGGMIMTLFLDRYMMPALYSLYGHREPIEGSSSMAH
jgi:cobalt-zinc-cadmium resistance protein CzcA